MSNPVIKNGKVRILLDILSFIAVGYLIGCAIWVFNFAPPHAPLGFPVELSLIDIIPAVAGIFWVGLRYGGQWPLNLLQKKWFVVSFITLIALRPFLEAILKYYLGK